MIHRIYSSDPRFKELRFTAGLNVLLSEKTANARKDQTRNAAGKSSTVELIHFILGSDVKAGNLFKAADLSEHVFGMEMDLLGQKLSVERCPSKANEIRFPSDVPQRLRDLITDAELDCSSIKVASWRVFLSEAIFDLKKDIPSFRMLFPYFCRLEGDGGFQDPFKSFSKQPPWQKNVAIAYLLGLNSDILHEMEQLRSDEAKLKKLKKELKDSKVVGEVIGESKNIRGKITLKAERISQLENEITNYQVLPEYRHIEKEASQLARQIADLSDRNTADKRLISDLEASLEAEKTPEQDDLERLYKAAGVQLPDVTLKRIDSVKEFHQTVIRNRKGHLEGEIHSAKDRVRAREEASERHSAKQQELMRLLDTHGALDQFNKLQSQLSGLRAEHAQLEKHLELASKIERGGADAKLRRVTSYKKLLQDFEDRQKRVDDAVRLFGKLSSRLSERSAILEVEPSEKGLTLAIENDAKKSKGVREQQIFCLDMLFAVMQKKKPKHLDFLVHDSHLFDAMEERQVANAIEAGATLAEEHGFQYIITMNSDRIPHSDFSDGFDFENHVVSTRFNDKTSDGGLFGFRFSA